MAEKVAWDEKDQISLESWPSMWEKYFGSRKVVYNSRRDQGNKIDAPMVASDFFKITCDCQVTDYQLSITKIDVYCYRIDTES